MSHYWVISTALHSYNKYHRIELIHGHFSIDTITVKEAYRKPTTGLQDVNCCKGSHSVTCHLIQVNMPRLNTGQASWYPGGMEG